MRCQICGREFSPHGFQVVVPGLGQGFDRVECAHEANAMGLPASSAAGAVGPPVPIVATAAAAGAAGGASGAAHAARTPLLVGSKLALLAAGTAVTVFLWLRVFAAEPASLRLPHEAGAPRSQQSQVPAAIDLSPGSEHKAPSGERNPSPSAPAASAGPEAKSPGRVGATLVENQPPSQGSGPGNTEGPTMEPTSHTPPVEPGPPREPPTPARPDKSEKPEHRGGPPLWAGKPAKPCKEKDHTIPHNAGRGKKIGHLKHHC
jgi:hypothetical protein